MYFVIVANDGPAAGTQERRLAVRPEHMDGLRRLRIEGRLSGGGGILDDTGRMIGSILVCDFPDRTALDAYLREEVYARERVWQDISVYPLRRVDWDALLGSAPASYVRQETCHRSD